MTRRGLLNPYFWGKPITEASRFYGRHNLVESLVDTLTTTQQNAIVLHGQPRIGKTSLLYRLRRDDSLLLNHQPVFFDLSIVKGRPPAYILANIAQTIVDELELTIPIPDETRLDKDYRHFQRTFLPEVYRHLDNKRMLFLLDEFDGVVPSDAIDFASTDTLFGYLQRLIEEEQAHLAFIFVVGRRLDLLAEGYRRLFKGARTEPVGRLGREDTFSLLIELGQRGNISYSDEALAEIWTLTNGHPYLTQLIGSELFDRLQKEPGRPVSVADVTACLDKAMQHGQGALDWFWIGFNAEQQWILAAVADLTDQQESVSDVEIDQTLQQHHLLFSTPLGGDKAYRDLLQGDFLLETERRRYRFAVEFIRRWIVKYHPLNEIQRQIEESSPEAQRYYELGRLAFGKADLGQAAYNYQLAIEHNPHFARAHLDLAVALRGLNQLEEAIAEGEEAFKLDPAGGRETLVELRLLFVQALKKAGDEAGMLAQGRRILELDPEHAEARGLVSQIYLAQIEACLAAGDLAEAWGLVQELVDLVPLLQDELLSQQIRTLWLAYSQKLTQEDPPNWAKAQMALGYLKAVDLQDETVRLRYNEVTIERAETLLNEDNLEEALNLLVTALKEPLPVGAIKETLFDYSRRQVAQQHWVQAEQTLIGLCRLVDEAESQATQLNLYRQWGDTLIEQELFDEAIAVYQRGTAADFRGRIVQAYLKKAALFLAGHDLVEAEKSYREAIAIDDTQEAQPQARNDLVAYFNECRREQTWSQAQATLEALSALDLAGSDGPTWQIDLRLDQAEVELSQNRFEMAFQILSQLEPACRSRIKQLVMNHIRSRAQRGKWQSGAEILERLNKLPVRDQEILFWRTNWLYLWAKAIFPEDKPDKDAQEAKRLCQQILELAPDETPVLDFLDDTELPTEKEPAGLRRQVCALAVAISLAQAQECLSQNHLKEAQELFAEALRWPIQPENIKKKIQDQLRTFSHAQRLKEEWEQAQRALEVLQELGLGDREISESLTRQKIQQAHLQFKRDRLVEAFEILVPLKTMEEPERQQIKAMVYQFSRLYAGRDQWQEAQRTLEELRHWLAPAGEAQEMIEALDELNWEQLDFTRGQHLASKPVLAPPEGFEKQIEDLVSEMQLISNGYENARSRELKAEKQESWAKALVETGLILGQAYLNYQSLEQVSPIYQKILNIESQLDPREEISRSLHHYSERMLHLQDWDEARKALELLKALNLPAPDGYTRPDPRVDGAIQRVILSHADVLLKEERIEETFAQLRLLPLPWPEGAIQELIFSYREHCRERQEWPKAILALESLNDFLADDRQQIRSQDALEALVEGLRQWGQLLEEDDRLEEAAKSYEKGRTYTLQEARPRNIELAEHYINVAMKLGQRFLEADPLTPEPDPVIKQAIEWYQKILHLPEHRPEHEHDINQALYAHACKLAGARQWPRAYQLLQQFDILYPRSGKDYRTQFALWRRELAFDEAKTWLNERELKSAFESLTRLKAWLEQRNPPQVTWQETRALVKTLVYEGFCQGWLDQEEAWQLTIRALADLAELIPDDGQIIGWQVHAFCQWGVVLQKQKQLEAAISRYKQALARAPYQQAIPVDQIELSLLGTQLALAQQFLAQNSLNEAVSVYRQILERRTHDYLNRADEIRRAMKNYSDHLIQSHSPDWAAGLKVFICLRELGLNNDQVFQWQQDLILKEISAILAQNELDRAFARLESLEPPWPLEALKDIVQSFVYDWTGLDTWLLAIKLLQLFDQVWPDNGAVRQWVVEEADKLGDRLSAQGNLHGAEAAYSLATTLQ